VSWHVLVKDRFFDNSLLNFDKPRHLMILDFRFWIGDCKLEIVDWRL
jgi:hypothetical protein